MNFRVELSRRAAGDIAGQHRWLSERSTAAADRWRNGIDRATDRLAVDPTLWPVTPEAERYGRDIRQMLHGKRRGVFRILFIISGETVIVLRVRHASQDDLAPEEL